MISTEKKQAAIKSAQAHKDDTGGAGAQIAVASERIKELTEHLKTNKKDYAARRGLLQLVGKRRRLLNYVAKRNPEGYKKLLKDLGIRR